MHPVVPPHLPSKQERVIIIMNHRGLAAKIMGDTIVVVVVIIIITATRRMTHGYRGGGGTRKQVFQMQRHIVIFQVQLYGCVTMMVMMGPSFLVIVFIVFIVVLLPEAVLGVRLLQSRFVGGKFGRGKCHMGVTTRMWLMISIILRERYRSTFGIR